MVNVNSHHSVSERAPEHLARALVVFGKEELSAKFYKLLQAYLAIVILVNHTE